MKFFPIITFLLVALHATFLWAQELQDENIFGVWQLEGYACSDKVIKDSLDWEFQSEYGVLKILNNSFVFETYIKDSVPCFIEISGQPRFEDKNIYVDDAVITQAQGCTTKDRVVLPVGTSLGILRIPFQLKIINGAQHLYITDLKTRNSCDGSPQVLIYKRQDLLF